MIHLSLLSMVQRQIEQDPEWFAALHCLMKNERSSLLSCKHEKGERELKGKLSDGSHAKEQWNSYVVRFKLGSIVGEGETMQKAWEDALSLAIRAFDLLNKRHSLYYGWVI